MKKITFLLVALIAGSFAMQMNAQPEREKANMPHRSTIYSYLPDGFQQVGETSIYYSIAQRSAIGPGSQCGISILGEINGSYYSCTFGSYDESNPGAGFIAAFNVNGGSASYVNCLDGTTIDGVKFTARVEPQGTVAARIVYTLENTTSTDATINAGAWADIMIGDNDKAPISCLKNAAGETYALDLKESTEENSPLVCVLFGDNITGVTAADDFWFGHFAYNYYTEQIIGDYNENASHWMEENGDYDSGMGICWKNRTVPAGESIELSYLISVGEIDFDDPVIPDPEDPEDPEGNSRFSFNVEPTDLNNWNIIGDNHEFRVYGEYEHPYGQNGYLEYMADGVEGNGIRATNEWVRIGELVSSADNGYSLTFSTPFNEEITDIHTLRFRFTLGLGEYTYLDTLSWADVRGTAVTGLENRVYNGQPQVYEVTVGDQTITIGENGEYVNAGTYTFDAIEGDYYEGTIGLNSVDFVIEKAQATVTVSVPDDTQYDGNTHAASVTYVTEGCTYVLTYMNNATGEFFTEAPSAIGIYSVYVEVIGNENINGIEKKSYGQFQIYADPTPDAVEELTVGTEDNGAWYTIDGARVAEPTQPGLYIHNGKKYIVK